MASDAWLAFCTTYFELYRLNRGAAEEYARFPADTAPALHPSLAARLVLEKRMIEQNRRQQRSWGGIMGALNYTRSKL